MIVYEDGALIKSTGVTDLLLDNFNISLETTGRYVSWINGKNKLHNISIKNIVRSVLLDSN